MGRPPSGSTETAPTPVLRTVPAARPPGIRSVRQRPANKLTTRFEQHAWPAEFKKRTTRAIRKTTLVARTHETIAQTK